MFNEEIAKKEDTIRVFSRYQNWITIDPKKPDRKKPLEKIKELKKDVTSVLMPKWMEIEYKENKNNFDKFKSIEYNYPLRQKCKKMVTLVDKDINPKRLKHIIYKPNKSIFSIDDFRHDVTSKKEAEFYGSQVSKLPKKFFDWDDGKKFNPKYKKDI